MSNADQDQEPPEEDAPEPKQEREWGEPRTVLGPGGHIRLPS
ncbi:hypothetical protein AB0G83_30125 [Streptomyces klenkii]